MLSNVRHKIAIVGTGISGLSAAWLLSQRHAVTVYERADRIGGHSNTILASVGGRSIPVDIGFIVFNRRTYPNLTALFEFFGVPTQVAEMSFGVSMDGGTLEYSGSGLSGVLDSLATWSVLASGRCSRTLFVSIVRRRSIPISSTTNRSASAITC